ncbi:hypothetical protein, partial [Sphingomonas sp.]|uniref:hypothetical protein n=1 Tax=Sphingomonas sp. TaxID=28214 RepID=UPI0025E4A9DF
MAIRLTAKQNLMIGTTLVGVGAFIMPNAAMADCLPNVGGTVVTCLATDLDGYNGSAVNSLTINVNNGASVTGGALSTG